MIIKLIKKFLSKHDIKFQKSSRVKVLTHLPVLLILEKIWKFKKRLLGKTDPVIHLYAVCWNEAKLLPFMLDYYEPFVDHFYIYDNYSDDETDAILKLRKNVTIRKFDTGGQFDEFKLQELRNNEWKKSRGKADWTLVVDIDEFLYYSNVLDLLKDTKYTVFIPNGFEMVSSQFPKVNKSIIEQIKKGVPQVNYSKKVLFNPYHIVETNYELGSHIACPEGIIKYGVINKLKILHYKFLGIDYVISRMSSYKKRLLKEHIDMGINIHYNKEYEFIKEEIENYLVNATSVVD